MKSKKAHELVDKIQELNKLGVNFTTKGTFLATIPADWFDDPEVEIRFLLRDWDYSGPHSIQVLEYSIRAQEEK